MTLTGTNLLCPGNQRPRYILKLSVTTPFVLSGLIVRNTTIDLRFVGRWKLLDIFQIPQGNPHTLCVSNTSERIGVLRHRDDKACRLEKESGKKVVGFWLVITGGGL